jgi:hypothetical protein
VFSVAQPRAAEDLLVMRKPNLAEKALDVGGYYEKHCIHNPYGHAEFSNKKF